MANGSNLVGGRLRPQATRRARSARSGSDFGWRLGQSDRNGRRLAQRMLGWHRTTERILPHAIRQKFTVGADGELEPFTEGSSKPMSVVVTNADTVVEQFDRRTPWFMAPGTNAGSVPALAFFSKIPGTGSVAQKPPWTLLYHWPRNECPISAWFVWRWDTTGNGSDRQTVLRASSDDWRPLHSTRSVTIGFSGAVSGLSAHFTAGSSQLMHWRSVRPEMVTTGITRFPHFGQRVIRSMTSSRFFNHQ